MYNRRSFRAFSASYKAFNSVTYWWLSKKKKYIYIYTWSWTNLFSSESPFSRLALISSLVPIPPHQLTSISYPPQNNVQWIPCISLHLPWQGKTSRSWRVFRFAYADLCKNDISCLLVLVNVISRIFLLKYRMLFNIALKRLDTTSSNISRIRSYPLLSESYTI